MSEVGLEIEKGNPRSPKEVFLGFLRDKLFLSGRGKEPRKGSVEKWRKEGFSLAQTIESLNGPLIEVAGPTWGGYKLVSFGKLNRKVFVSSLNPNACCCDEKTGRVFYEGKPDFRADATVLPLRDGSASALFGSCLPVEIRKKAIAEIYRVLEEGGLLIWQGGIDKDVEEAKALGFEVMQYRREFCKDDTTDYQWDLVFQKTPRETTGL